MHRRLIILAVIAGVIVAVAAWALGTGITRTSAIDVRMVEAIAAGLGARVAGLLADPVDPATLTILPATCAAEPGVIVVRAGSGCTATIPRRDDWLRRARIDLIAGGRLSARFDPAMPPADDRPRSAAGPVELTPAAAETTVVVFPEGGLLRLDDCRGAPCRVLVE